MQFCCLGNYIYWIDWWNKDIEKIPISGQEEASVILSPIKDMEDLISVKVVSGVVQCKAGPDWSTSIHITYNNQKLYLHVREYTQGFIYGVVLFNTLSTYNK